MREETVMLSIELLEFLALYDMIEDRLSCHLFLTMSPQLYYT